MITGAVYAGPTAALAANDAPPASTQFTLAAVAPLAGATPRAVRRLVNLYGLARLDGGGHAGALALALALDLGGTPAERQALHGGGETAGAPVVLRESSPRLRDAVEAARAFDGTLTRNDLAAASARAARFSPMP